MNRAHNFYRLLSVIFFLMYAYLLSCSSGNEPKTFDCNLSDLSIDAIPQNPTSCSSNNGSITCWEGDYIIRVKDKNGCEGAKNN
jgi:hypothetical protein